MEDQQDSNPTRDLNAEALSEIYHEQASAENQKEIERRQRELSIFVRDTFDTDMGRQVLDWLNATYMNTLSFTPGDPHATSFNEGQRHVVLSLHELINQANGEGSVHERP